MPEFTDFLFSSNLQSLDDLSQKTGVDVIDLEETLNRIIKKYPINLIDNVVIASSKDFSEKMKTEINELFDCNSKPQSCYQNEDLQAIVANATQVGISIKEFKKRKQDLQKLLQEVENL